jgi:hypothetical protein
VSRNTRDAVVGKTGDQAHVTALLIAPRKRRPHSIANAAADRVERRQISLVVARQILWSFENSRETANLWVSKGVPQRLKPSSTGDFRHG